MTDTVKYKINKMAYGYVFTASDFSIDVSRQKTVNKILDNLVAEGKIKRLVKGRFYKAKKTEFGDLPPNSYQIVKDLLVENGKTVGYLTGYSIFNKLGLTTQNSAVLQIATTKLKRNTKRGIYRIAFVRQTNTITKENIPLLQYLDCLRYFKIIPDASADNTCKRLLYLLSEFSAEQREKLKKLSLKYQPQTVALLGAMLETINPEEETGKLQKSLNFQTFYELHISDGILLNPKKWNIR
jgi:mRNA-degrading endonuclease RelE of RelBE toxin-antitoxin system